MNTDREQLREFCEKHAVDQALVFRAFEYLNPFIKMADNGPYPLKSEDEFDAVEMKRAIALAVVRRVEAVRFISIARAIDDAERESGNRERNGLWYALERMLFDALWAKHNVTMWGPLKQPLIKGQKRPSLGDALWGVLDRSLCRPLTDSLQTALRQSGFGYRLCESLPKNLCHALLYFVGFAVGGNQKRMDAMVPLMQLMPGCIPVGEKRDPTKDPMERELGTGEWLVLVS
ncbi:hypothetical protein AMJ57_00590 [Parcubacteria bacterium SG8_24]|nr:MAG: hypothetical protein AMJ57_00590 [Parcubacteria bacterium SG8_24]